MTKRDEIPQGLVFEVHELPLADLRAWAAARGVEVDYAGPSLEGRMMYAAVSGRQMRVTRTATLDPRRTPILWHSPLCSPGRERERW
ncbi:hypothetical protein [Nocardiopsis sp. NPDC057823]|uniref:hypothetical protein n=1 Tax=Nocardiopsis sp. NPDC057823 TaxID=3346256 RepID=UPI0036724C55